MQNRVDRVLAVLRHTFEHGDIFLVKVDQVNSELAALVFVLIKQLMHWYCDERRMRGTDGIEKLPISPFSDDVG